MFNGFRRLRRAEELHAVVAVEICMVGGGATPLGQLFSTDVSLAPGRKKPCARGSGAQSGLGSQKARHRSIIVNTESDNTLCNWQESQRAYASRPAPTNKLPISDPEAQKKRIQASIKRKQEVTKPESTVCNLARSCWKSREVSSSPSTPRTSSKRKPWERIHKGSKEYATSSRSSLRGIVGTLQTSMRAFGYRNDEADGAEWPEPSSPLTPNKVKQNGASTWTSSWTASQLNKWAKAFSMSIPEILKARRMFDNFDVAGAGLINQETYRCMLQAALQEKLQTPDETLHDLTKTVCFDASKTEDMAFEDFLLWFSNNAFNNALIVTETEQKSRELSQKFDVPMVEIDEAKRRFNEVDKNGNGSLEMDEFRALMERILRIPKGAELAQNRALNMWRQIEKDGDGKVGFLGFLPWYLRNFPVGHMN